jgi:hypothetical protein
VLGALALGIGLAVATVRIDGWSGASVPELRFIWQPRGAPELAAGSQFAPANDVRRIDVVTTTPHDFPGFLGPHRSAALPNVHLARDWRANPPTPRPCALEATRQARLALHAPCRRRIREPRLVQHVSHAARAHLDPAEALEEVAHATGPGLCV